MPIKLNSSGGGSVTLDTPSTASAYTLTVPAITGTAVVTGSTGTVSQAMLGTGVAGNGPAFSAYQSSAQTVAATTDTKVQFQTEEFDTANCFDSTTNYRFTPNVAGYYQVNAAINGVNVIIGNLYKNGSLFKRGSQYGYDVGSQAAVISALVYMNGSTDYLEVYVYRGSTGSVSLTAGQQFTYFQAFLARSA